MLRNKTLFIDCDDTLIMHDLDVSCIPESSYKAIDLLKANGHRLILATGRSNFQVEGIMKELDIKDAILFNGTLVIAKEKTIYDNPIGNGELNIIVQELLKNGNSVYAVDKEYQYIKDPKDIIMRFITERMRPGHKNYDDSYIRKIKQIDEKPRKYYFFMSLDKNHIIKNLTDVLENLQVNNWEDNVIDISNVGVNKYSGIQVMQDYYNINKNDIYAFGDGYNDIEMIKNVKHGIMMGNSPKELQKHATYVAPNIEDDGFFKACQEFKLI
ncbi:MAG: Cof-type HAD-IIB family hydrolase [Clostridia bacterium]